MRVLVTGGSGVLGQGTIPLLRDAGHDVEAPGSRELDLFDAGAVSEAARGADAIYHLATRIPPPESQGDREAWRDNDRLRTEATRLLVDAALAGGADRFVYSSVAFVYPMSGEVDETTPVADEISELAASTLDAEREVGRFADRGGRGVTLRLGLLYGPGTGNDEPAKGFRSFGATLWIEDAHSALAAAVSVPGGTYNVVSDGERVSNRRFQEATGWRPEHRPAPSRA
jgi:nucleoside-diphosphate-sugar epimerase